MKDNRFNDMWELKKTARKMAGERIKVLEERISWSHESLYEAENNLRAIKDEIAKWKKELTNLRDKYNIPA